MITLTNPLAITAGGVTQETDNQGAAVYMEVVHPTSIRLFYRTGNVAASVFTAGTIGGDTTVTVDLVTGNWSTGKGGQSGTIVGAALTNLQTTVKGWRNAAENFAVNNGIIVGVQTAWV